MAKWLWRLFGICWILCLCWPGISLAKPAPAYQVEMIIYQHVTAKGLESELWPEVHWQPEATHANPYPWLSTNYFHLTPEQDKLAKTPGYQVLLHVAWRQPSHGPNSGQLMHIFGGQVYDTSGRAVENYRYGTATFDPSMVWQINGTFQMVVKHYLNSHYHFVLTLPSNDLNRISRHYQVEGDAKNFTRFSIQGSERMRSQELNYLSHPLFGVLIKIYPVPKG